MGPTVNREESFGTTAKLKYKGPRLLERSAFELLRAWCVCACAR